ncbi:hypothetical protein PTSG_04634 [Salpingoeca rosetta]|uniref:AP complex subunit beta n=1 Tax=Salpingoeca rosetta (strain ATCC 50818 / BSB-021) TaxID=946362 RepID=F2U800_SALR5|nr:uncharacterized protein PTSG_04634 [Salpingoeca rosetta]EGD72905.1 hypothetical protein PTSG_04634 [Salpingoeca rosetta]|eukprot:XP_004994727.1 hypothetical protein PTSG_04634 [Salpingoeca rosetta]
MSKERRSDVNELRQLIRSPEVQKDPTKYREAVEKVILYMTLGVDVSRLFSEIVLASATRDLVQKKLVYLYLCNYAESNTDLALLTVNTLQKDCRDTNPVIRGLALRSMCNLRVPNLVEYLISPLRDGLSDSSAYVRKTAIMGCVKLFYLDENAVDDNSIPDALYSMLSDRDPQVVANAVIALEEGACRFFLRLTDKFEDMHDDIYDRLKVPLITLMSSSASELSYTVLHHIHLLIKRRPHIFANDYKALFSRFTDPAYVKAKKLSILTDIADESNVEKIVEELAACVTDIDVDMARRAVRSVGKIAIKLPAAIANILKALLAFLELRSPYLTAETLVVMRDILRRYPGEADGLVPQLYDLVDLATLDDEPEARAALVWLLGEFGQLLEEGPYVLESFIDDVNSEKSPTVRLQLLTSAVKLFFKRPPEMQKMLGRLFDSIISDEMHQDVHDRALLYYRLLKTNYAEAQRVIAGTQQTVQEFVLFEPESNEEVFREFNSLSVMYSQPRTLALPVYAIWGGLMYILLSGEFVTAEQHAMLQTLCIPVAAFSRVTQIATIMRNKCTGQLSVITTGLNFAGAAARVLTTLKEVDDLVTLANYHAKKLKEKKTK